MGTKFPKSNACVTLSASSNSDSATVQSRGVRTPHGSRGRCCSQPRPQEAAAPTSVRGATLADQARGGSRRLVWASHSLFFPFSFSLFISCIEFVRTTSVNKIIQVSCVRFCNTPTVHRVACSPPRQVALVAMRLPPKPLYASPLPTLPAPPLSCCWRW